MCKCDTCRAKRYETAIEGLKEIIEFAKKNPGRGYSCGKKAENILKEISESSELS